MNWLVHLALPEVRAPVLCGVQLVFLGSEVRLGDSILSMVKHEKKMVTWYTARLKHKLLAAALFSYGPTSWYKPRPRLVPLPLG